MLLEGRKAIVTGGSSGIGKAAVARLAAEGASVCVNYYSEKDADDAKAVVAEVEKAGRVGLALQADIAAAVACDEASYVTGTTIVVDGRMALYPKFV